MGQGYGLRGQGSLKYELRQLVAVLGEYCYEAKGEWRALPLQGSAAEGSSGSFELRGEEDAS